MFTSKCFFNRPCINLNNLKVSFICLYKTIIIVFTLLYNKIDAQTFEDENNFYFLLFVCFINIFQIKTNLSVITIIYTLNINLLHFTKALLRKKIYITNIDDANSY